MKLKEFQDLKCGVPMNELIKKDLKHLDAGDVVELRYYSEKLPVYSSKDIFKTGENRYCIMHNIDGTETYFDRKGIIAVMSREVSAWDGNIN